MKPVVTIEYCSKCNWLLRSAYMAQEFLITFENELKGVTLQPAEKTGSFCIRVDNEIIFDRKVYGGFADIKVLKQLVRDVVCPDKDLGHSDRKA